MTDDFEDLMKYLLGVLLFCQALAAAAHPDAFPKVATAYLVESNGAVLWEKQAHQRLPPASLTKLMTALLVSELNITGSPITVSRAAARETGSRLGLKAGEIFQSEDLLAATLIASANDGCRALADFVGGDQTRFVQMMNRRAKELGMSDTHFSNACGHDAPDHFSSASDLAQLAHEVLKHPALLKFTGQIAARISTIDGARSFQFENKNELIGRYVGAFGLKSGHTPNAGKCLIAYAKRSDQRVLLVMLRGKNRWWDAVEMLDAAFKFEKTKSATDTHK
jgi:D-alanyl-D-alanine carboxypeptidase (penicillin-binding protein 5/6)